MASQHVVVSVTTSHASHVTQDKDLYLLRCFLLGTNILFYEVVYNGYIFVFILYMYILYFQ